ncbi:DUF881 domain-containing protein [Phytohabitans kaempferiae]|uniref:DUF881 domain-containing protein n=1 Tax=Phytohabitans kaempferiae TaxID=1620943 RepID=A0ABV6MDM8_9ACTN
MEYTSGVTSWRVALRRAAAGLFSRRPRRGRFGWSVGVPLIAVAAGLLFTTSATTANGTSLREDRRPHLAQLIEDRRERVEESDRQRAALLNEVEAQTEELAGTDAPIAEQRSRGDASRQDAGFTALRGPGLTVELDDAPRLGESRPGNPSNDDLVVHQSDVQAVVNAMWSGGAEAMSIMGVRVISTSAVRCVGNTLLLHGRVYSPPFRITAIGDPAKLRGALDDSDGVQLFRDLVDHFGLGYRETVEGSVTVPAYDGSSALSEVEVPR